MRKLVMSLLVFISIAWLYPGAADVEPDWEDAINTAGRQRMLTQRITGSYIQAGLGANRESARDRLAQSVELFEQQHAELMRLKLPEAIHDALIQIGADWDEFRALANGELNREWVGQLVALDGKLLQACEQVVAMLEQASGSTQGRLVNISGRQRMLSQRIVKNYMLVAAGLAGQDTVSQIGHDRDEFRKSLNTLLSERNYSAQIGDKLAEVSAQWVWVESALDMTDDNYYPLIVADVCEKILQLLESLTRMYAAVEAS